MNRGIIFGGIFGNGTNSSAIPDGGFDAVPLGTQFFGVNPPQPSSIFIQTNNGGSGFTYLKSEYEELWSAADLDSVADGEWSQNFCYAIQRVNSTTFKPQDYSGYFSRIHDISGTIDPDGATRVVGDLQGQSTAIPTNPFITDNSGTHTHEAGTLITQFFDGTTDGGDGNNIIDTSPNAQSPLTVRTLTVTGNTAADGDHFHTIDSGGDTETRPNNYSENHYIKAKTRVPLQNELVAGTGVTINTQTVGSLLQHLINVNIATNQEVIDGIETTKAIAPSSLLNLFNQSTLSTDSCANIPVNNGSGFGKIMIQFGTVTAGGGFITETLPQAFPNAFIAVIPVHIASSHRNYNVDILSLSQFRVEAISAVSTSTRYIAIGY